jgi:hypothetical protein
MKIPVDHTLGLDPNGGQRWKALYRLWSRWILHANWFSKKPMG